MAVYLMSLMKIKTSSSTLSEYLTVMHDNWIYDICECARPSICVRENLYLHFLNFVVCACNREGTSHTSSRVDGGLE